MVEREQITGTILKFSSRVCSFKTDATSKGNFMILVANCVRLMQKQYMEIKYIWHLKMSNLTPLHDPKELKQLCGTFWSIVTFVYIIWTDIQSNKIIDLTWNLISKKLHPARSPQLCFVSERCCSPSWKKCCWAKIEKHFHLLDKLQSCSNLTYLSINITMKYWVNISIIQNDKQVTKRAYQ